LLLKKYRDRHFAAVHRLKVFINVIAKRLL